MKKLVLMAGSFLVLGVLWYVGPLSGQTQSQPNPPAAATPARTRIALLNLTYVIKNYVKYQHFQEEIKGIVEPAQNKDKELRNALEVLRKKVEDPTAARALPPGEREKLEKEGKDLQRQLEDNAAEIKVKLGKRSDEVMRTLFMDVYDAAQRYAASHDFELVLHYNDALTKDDFFSGQNIARKLNTGALMPLYWMQNMDISQDVVKFLNYNVNAASTPGATTGAPPAGGQH